MDDQLRARIRRFNALARQAESDGYEVIDGMVCKRTVDAWHQVWYVRLCRVEEYQDFKDYQQWKSAHRA
jgi:hypothetical protein